MNANRHRHCCSSDLQHRLIKRLALLHCADTELSSFNIHQWMSFCKWLAHNGLLICNIPALSKNAPIPITRQLNEAETIHNKTMHRRVDALKHFASAAREEHLCFELIKGMALSIELFGKPFARQSGDIDILVHPDDVPKADYLLRRCGWCQPGEAYRIRRLSRSGKSVCKALEEFRSPYPLRSNPFLPHVTSYFFVHSNGQVDVLELHDRFHGLSSSQCFALLVNSNVLNICDMPLMVPSRTYQAMLSIMSLYEDAESVRACTSGNAANILKGCVDIAIWLETLTDDETYELAELISKFCIEDAAGLALKDCLSVFPETILSKPLLDLPQTSGWNASLIDKACAPRSSAASCIADILETTLKNADTKLLDCVFRTNGEWATLPVADSNIPSEFRFRETSGECPLFVWYIPASFSKRLTDLALQVAVIGRNQSNLAQASVIDIAWHDGSWSTHAQQVDVGTFDVHAGLLQKERGAGVSVMPSGDGGYKFEVHFSFEFQPLLAIPSIHLRHYASLYRIYAGKTLVDIGEKLMGNTRNALHRDRHRPKY